MSNLSERYILAAYFDAATVGLYIAAFAIANRLPVIPSNFLADLFRPALFEAQNRHQPGVAGKVMATWLSALAAISILSVLLVTQFGDLLAYLLLQEAYRASAIQLMPWIVGAAIAATFTGALDQYLMSFGRSKILMIPKVIGPVVSVICSIGLIPHHALMGAALANLFGQAVQLLTTLLLVVAITRDP